MDWHRLDSWISWGLVGLVSWAAPGCTPDDGRADDDGIMSSIGPLTTASTSGTSGPSTSSNPTGSGQDSTATGVTGNDDDPTGSPVFDVGNGNETEGTMPCDVQQPTVTYVEPILIFVLDKSGSMSINQFDAGMAGTITRWNALHNTVSYLLSTYQTSIAFGSKLFPSANGCNVNAGLDVAPAVNNEAAIIGSMPAPNADLNLGGTSQTPVQRGMEEASAVIQTYDPATPKAVLLLLDGGVSTTCAGNSFAGTENVISDLWSTHGIPTYVVGVDISAGLTADMNAYAVAGGVPSGNPAEQFYNAVNTAELDMLMDGIVSEVLSCDIELNPEPEFPELTEVTVDGVPYNQIDLLGCEAGDPGWYWSVEYGQITLCGVACDTFKAVQQADVAFFCPAG